MVSGTTLEAYLSASKGDQLEGLKEWLRIPSISTLGRHHTDVARAAQWLASRMAAIGLEHVEVIETDGHPLVYADWLHAPDGAPTVLIYGHYDVQPVDPEEEWRTPPFAPAVRDDDLYARGASDDKGQLYVHLCAIEALLRTAGSLPVNVKLIVEGEEEIGSEAMAAWVPLAQERLTADLSLISDTHILAPDQPMIVYGLRGMWAGDVTVRGPQRDLHSGMYGGVVHNPNQALCELLAALHDGDGRVSLPGFYDGVAALDETERTALARVPYGEAELLAESGVPRLWGEPGYTALERIGARPTLEINGLWGGYIGDGFKTVIPAAAHAKISCRLVPGQDPARIGEMLGSYLTGLAPTTVEVTVETRQHAPATVIPLDSPAMRAAERAYERGFGAPPVFNREGGSIPIATLLQQTFRHPVILMGFGLPDDNLHAPNEKLHLPNFYRGIRTSIAFLQELA